MLKAEHLDKQLNKRARLLAAKLNKIRHAQARQIDILCNDMVSAHSDFIKRLHSLTFGVNFYESLLAQPDLRTLLSTAVELIKSCIPNSNVAIFLLGSDTFQLHMVDEDKPIEVDADKLESYFTPEAVNEICRANRVCTMTDMLQMGLQGSPNVLSKISAAAIPLVRFGRGVGFILVYRGSENKLTTGELERITSVTPGLCSAIKSYQANEELGPETIEQSDQGSVIGWDG